MNETKSTANLLDEVRLFMKYAVMPTDMAPAEQLVLRYRNSELVLRLLREHYKQLPEAREEAVTKVARLANRQGVFLFVVVATDSAYLYGVSATEVMLVGEYPCELDQETLAFFNLKNSAAFAKICLPTHELAHYEAGGDYEPVACPACGVGEGEIHLLGCAVEVCPWCSGQLSRCNCRFEQLQKEELENEDDLDALVDLLEEKGRIAFSREQVPAYPGTSKGLDQ